MSGLPDYDAALERALECVRALGFTEDVDLCAAGGRVLAEPVAADRDLPPFDRAQMDGYAVRSHDVDGNRALPVARTIAAGTAADLPVPEGHCVAIATGAPVPPDLDAVIQHELSDRGDRAVRFTIDRIDPGHAIQRRGADARAGDTVIEAGTILHAHHLGIAAAVGRQTLTARARPRAVVLTSGDEVVGPDAAVHPHQIRNSNGPMICALLARVGAAPPGHEHVPDDPDATIDALGAACERADLILTVGGISAGERDFFHAAFGEIGFDLSLRGAGIQPGKPVAVGRRADGPVVLALPGNPVSSLVCTCLFGWPIVRSMLGLGAGLPWREVELTDEVRPNPRRRAFRPAVETTPGFVRIPKWAGSGDLVHTAATHGIVRLPVQSEPVPAGTRLEFLTWPQGAP